MTQTREGPRDSGELRAASSPVEDAAPGLPCIVCGGLRWQSHFTTLIRCKDCGFVRANCDLVPGEIAELYSEKYFCGGEYSDYLAERELHRRNFEKRYAEIAQTAQRIESVFEVGCAYGFWLECLSRRGIRCAGVDVCAAAVDYARSVLHQQAVAGDFLALPLRKAAYQIYCMWDTIEHLAHPELFVSRIFELLPDGGWFFATTGDIGSRFARWRGAGWRMIHPPTHLHYFSAQTMCRFLQRHGFEVVRVCSAGYYRNLRSVLANIQVLGKGATRLLARAGAHVIPQALQRRLGVSLNLGDIMLACARKVGQSASC